MDNCRSTLSDKNGKRTSLVHKNIGYGVSMDRIGRGGSEMACKPAIISLSLRECTDTVNYAKDRDDYNRSRPGTTYKDGSRTVWDINVTISKLW